MWGKKKGESYDSTFLVSFVERGLQSSLFLSGLVVYGIQESFVFLQRYLC